MDDVFQEFANRSKIKLTWEVKVSDEICRRLAKNVGMAKVETMLGMDTYAKTFAPGTQVELSEEQEKAVQFLLKHAEKPKEPAKPIWGGRPMPEKQGLTPRRKR